MHAWVDIFLRGQKFRDDGCGVARDGCRKRAVLDCIEDRSGFLRNPFLACACPSNPGRSYALNLGDYFVFCIVLVGGDMVALREVVALPLDGLNHRFVDTDGFRVAELSANA